MSNSSAISDVMRQDMSLGPPVEPRDVLVPLGLLALNLLLQKRLFAFLVLWVPGTTEDYQILYRLFRLTPFGAAFDAGICLRTILCFERWNSISEESPRLELVWAQSPALLRAFARLVLALAATYRLLILTTFRGVGFTIFSAWALFASCLLNELLFSYSFHHLLYQTLPRLLPSVRNMFRSNAHRTPEILVAVCALACFVEVIHVCWLGQYLIPRTLWMDWARPQASGSRQGGANLLPVLGFWPSHSISGSIFYSLNLVMFCLLLSWSAFFIIVPYYLLLLAAVASIFAVAYLLPTLTLNLFRNTWIRHLVDPTSSLIHHAYRERPEPLPHALTLAGRLEIAVKIFLHVLAWSGLFFTYLSPILSHYLFHVSRGLISDVRTRLTATHIDGPQGSYAVLFGVLLLIAAALCKFAISQHDSRTAAMRKKPILSSLNPSRYESWSAGLQKRMETAELQRLVIIVWAISLFCILPVVYYMFCFDNSNTSKPAWTTRWL